ncbi:hypothetical protein PC128_g8931 [Phytophthora cactorum]|nr:hypothetical protein PC120_g10014 [Phytophthora cactorum]KAG3073664.1 hypothetical protein PC121_g8573 [Phytophthora cactorum]KAG3194909.1 hypothetical protein PC128_g8931 [Phytophthora cactorum]KAG4054691.1 hypothetical protein PC123_g10191 [Phytophthora cactorum]
MVDSLECLEAAHAVYLGVDMAEIAEDEGVFFHEETELLTQRRDQLAASSLQSSRS